MTDKNKTIGVDVEVELPESITTLMNKNVMSVDNIGGYTQNVLGKVLTIIDAVIPNPKQAKAVKDVVKNDIWSAYRTLQDWGLKQTNTESSLFPFTFEPEGQFHHFPDSR